MLAEIANKLPIVTGVPWLHGALTAKTVLHDGSDVAHWMGALIGQPVALSPEEQDSLSVLNQFICKVLEGDNFNFNFPNISDDDPLMDRIGALSSWSEGFTIALSVQSDARIDVLSRDAEYRDFLGVLTSIMELAYYGVSNDEADVEQNERDLTELIEYVRLAVHHFYELSPEAKT